MARLDPVRREEERKRMSNNTPDVEIQQEEKTKNLQTHHNAQQLD